MVMIRPPAFWAAPAGFRAAMLHPLGALYAAGTAWRLARGPHARLGVPVVCVGNLNVGGTGKTPLVIALATRLRARGVNVHVVSRGYGGTLAGPVRVDARCHRAAQVGDEPLLIEPVAPVWTARRRGAGARAALEAGASMVLLDDGFQNPELAKDLSIVVVDAHDGFQNGRVIPAGPLREPVRKGLARADFVVSLGRPKDRRVVHTFGVPCLTGALEPVETETDWAGVPVFAFAGIGQPAKFFRTLEELGASIKGRVVLADHQPLRPALVRGLLDQARRLSAHPVTTQKDAVRLPRDMRKEVRSLPVHVVLDDWGPLDRALAGLLCAHRPPARVRPGDAKRDQQAP